jgi:hypothetical protein
MFDPKPLHDRALKLLASAPDQATVQLHLTAADLPPGFDGGVWMVRHAVELGRAFVEALADRPAVRKVEIVCPQVFRIPLGFDIPPRN